MKAAKKGESEGGTGEPSSLRSRLWLACCDDLGGKGGDLMSWGKLRHIEMRLL